MLANTRRILTQIRYVMNLEQKPLSETTRERFRDEPLGFVQNFSLTQLVVFPRSTVPSRSFTASSAQSAV